MELFAKKCLMFFKAMLRWQYFYCTFMYNMQHIERLFGKSKRGVVAPVEALKLPKSFFYACMECRNVGMEAYSGIF